jgi:hypothetical protein
VIYDNNGGVLAVYPPGSEGHCNFYRGLEILARMYRKYLADIQNEKKKREERTTQIFDQTDKKIIKRAEQRKLKCYNLSQTAMILNVPRQTLYYWIKKGWVTPKRDYRNYPFFTVFDIEHLIKQRHTVPSA